MWFLRSFVTPELAILKILATLIVIFLIMPFHEFAHGFVAYKLGDETARLSGRLTLNPFKHLDPFMSVILPMMLAIMHMPVFGGAKPVPINTRNLKYGEWGFALVALAGPAINILLAFIFFAIAHFAGIPISDAIYTNSSVPTIFFSTAIFVNIGFAVFNMLPIPPLDGSRLLYAIAPDGIRPAIAAFEKYGVFIIYFLILIGGSIFSVYISTAISSIFHLFTLIFN